MLILFLVAFSIFCIQVAIHIRHILNGKPESKPDHIKTRIGHVFRAAFGQSRVRERWWGKAHTVIFYAFLIFLLATVEILVRDSFPDFELNHLIGDTPAGLIHLVQTWFAALTLVAMVMLITRRIVKRKQLRSTFEAYLILGLIACLMLSHFGVMTANFALDHEPGWLRTLLPLTSRLSTCIPGHQPANSVDAAQIVLHFASWFHIACVALFFVIIPMGKHLHIVMAFPSLLFQFRRYDEEKKPVLGVDTPDVSAFEKSLEDAIEHDVPEDQWPVLGAEKVRDLPRHALLNAFACTQCQRCTDACPMVAAGLGQGPMQSMLDLRKLCKKPDAALASPHGSKGEGVIGLEELWNCTQCEACNRACSIGADHVARILEMRRAAFIRESYPPALAKVFSQFERTGNPWGYPKKDRTNWQCAIGNAQCAIGDRQPTNESTKLQASSSTNRIHKILLFSGCFASYDPKARKTQQKAIQWLIDNGFDVQFLDHETCCGEPMRKLGNESAFDQCMQSNLEQIQKHPHDIILTLCPHCAYTLRHEYATKDVRLNAMHLLEFMAQLWKLHEIDFKPNAEKYTNLYMHLPCKLSKTPEYPTDLIRFIQAMGIQLPDKDVAQAHCCGAGGGQFFLDTGREMTHVRARELEKHHPDCIITACPFCTEMLSNEVHAPEDAQQTVPVENIIDRIEQFSIRNPQT